MIRRRTLPKQIEDRGVALGGQAGAMTFAEIGEVLGMSPSAAFAVYQRGLKKLRKLRPEAIEVLRQVFIYSQRRREVGSCPTRPQLS